MSSPLATHDYIAAEANAAFEFLKRTRWELRELRYVRVFPDRLQIIDVTRGAAVSRAAPRESLSSRTEVHP